MTITISIDCMGGDHGPSVTIPAALAFLKHEPEAELILVGLEDQVRAELKKHHAQDNPRISVRNASEVVAMDDPVEVALRRKKDSSMRVAIELVKDGQARACVSAGNTGALMAMAKLVLTTMPGIERPAIAAQWPTLGRPCIVLDLGANIGATARQLADFALMGAAMARAVFHIERPRVGLLNIGV
ncbi:MAG TPA: phosphate acyltransferase, partial [Telluria sp.]